MVLAGGVTVIVPHGLGYSGAGRRDCRRTATAAPSTPRRAARWSGSGAGVVVLKRLADAVADGDTIHAVIRGFATNNDGAFKVGFTAPCVEGQARGRSRGPGHRGACPPSRSPTSRRTAPARRWATRSRSPPSPRRSRRPPGGTGFCALGSVKTNIGHLDAAAGVAGLIKAVPGAGARDAAAEPPLRDAQPAASTSRRAPSTSTPSCRPWRPEGWPRRAGVSAFAIGGANAHVILEEPPAAGAVRAGAALAAAGAVGAHGDGARGGHRPPSRPSPRAAGGAGDRLADIAYTLQVGRRAFRHRRVLVGPRSRRTPSRSWRGAIRGGCSPAPPRRRCRRWPSCSPAWAPSTPAWPAGCTATMPGSARGSTTARSGSRRSSGSICGRSCFRKGSEAEGADGARSPRRFSAGARGRRPPRRDCCGGPRCHSRPSSRSSTRWPPACSIGGSGRRRWWASASASTWRPASPACCRSTMRCAWWPGGPG